MSEKRQGTALNTHKRMLLRYSDGFHHKHNKDHLLHRQHTRSHPVLLPDDIETEALHGQNGMHRVIKANRMRARKARSACH